MNTKLTCSMSWIVSVMACGAPPAADEVCSEAPGSICTYMGNGVAGLGHDGVAPTQVSLYLPQDVTVFPNERIYVLDWNNHRVRTVNESGVVETVIGTGELGDAPEGPGLNASLNHPTHVSVDPEGKMVLSAWHNSKVMRWDPDSRMLINLCGTGARDYAGDEGPANKAVLDLPVATAFDNQNRMLIMDQANQRIRRVEKDGSIHTIVGPDSSYMPTPDGYQRVCAAGMDGAETCKLCSPESASDPDCAARKPQGFAGDGEPGTKVVMYLPFSQSAPPAGRMEFSRTLNTLYFADTGNHRIRALSPEGIVETVAGTGPAKFDERYRGGYGGDGGDALQAKFSSPSDVAVDDVGNLFVADTANSCVRKVDASGTITTVAGICQQSGYGGDGGPANKAKLDRPYGVAVDNVHGTLLIADTHNHRIRIVYGVVGK